jgi:triacylglycerol esterase/lipase EstA (alpha/beta hydrolase family)
MNQKSDIEWNWFDFIDNPIYTNTGSGEYSWNGMDTINTEQKQWFREWKESRIAI